MKFSKFLRSYDVTVYRLTTISDYLETDFQPPYHDISVLQYLGNIKLFSQLSSSFFFFFLSIVHIVSWARLLTISRSSRQNFSWWCSLCLESPLCTSASSLRGRYDAIYHRRVQLLQQLKIILYSLVKVEHRISCLQTYTVFYSSYDDTGILSDA